MATEVFIGVVSHAASRFSDSQGELGLAAQLGNAMRTRDVPVEVAVNTGNLHDPLALPVTRRTEQESLTAQLRVARTWARYLGHRRGLRWWSIYGLRWVKRAFALVSGRRPQVVTRLINIELSHLDLMRRGLASNATWILVIEDDAASSDIDDCADGLLGIMASPSPPAFANVSQSFPLADLEIGHLLTVVPDESWAGPMRRSLLQSERPVTNTVCAVLYRSDFLQALVSELDALPMTPVLPIDWKLNVALMHLHATRAVPASGCWLVDPAPITQRSMGPVPGSA